LLVVYVVLFSPWLTVSRVVVVGLADNDRVTVTDRVRDFLHNRPWYTFSRRALFVPTETIAGTVAGMPEVAAVQLVRYSWRDGVVTITVDPGLPRFVFTLDGQSYSVYESGKLVRTGPAAEPTKLQSLVLPSDARIALDNQTMLLTARTARVLAGLRRNLLDLYVPTMVAWYIEPVDYKEPRVVTPSVVTTTLNNIPVATTTATLSQPLVPEPVVEPVVALPKNIAVPITAATIEARITVDPTHNYRLIFDIQREPANAAHELRQLLEGLGVDRLSQLAYIDLRIADKAFVCLRNAPCATAAP
jgi:hypothetical protein